MLSFLTAQPQSPEEMRRYRAFLSLTQARLATSLGTTATSVSRWESETTPISQSTLTHLRQLVMDRLKIEISQLFGELMPRLSLSRYNKLMGHPRAEFAKDGKGNLYLGSVFIDPGYRKHVLYCRADNRKWYGLDRDEKATLVDEEFLRQVIAS